MLSQNHLICEILEILIDLVSSSALRIDVLKYFIQTYIDKLFPKQQYLVVRPRDLG